MAMYTIVLVPDRDEGGYSVSVPALPGLLTQGDTREEALDAACEAIAFHLECLADEGVPIPSDDSGVGDPAGVGVLIELIEVPST